MNIYAKAVTAILLFGFVGAIWGVMAGCALAENDRMGFFVCGWFAIFTILGAYSGMKEHD